MTLVAGLVTIQCMRTSAWRRFSSRLNLIIAPPLFIFLPIPHGTSIPLQRRAIVTTVLIWTNFIIFIITRHSGYYIDILLEYGHTAVDDRIPTLFTHMFLHGGYLHVLGNMLFLWIFGANVEDRFGRVGFLAFYLASGVAAAYIFSHTTGSIHGGTPMIGASGAVYGVMGAFLILFPLAEIRITFVIMLFMFFWRITTFPVIALFIAPLFLGVNLFLYSLFAEMPVGFMAHVGGFLFAIPCALLYRHLYPEPKSRPRAADIQLEEERPKPPESEQERQTRQIRQALYNHHRPAAIRMYREGMQRFGAIPMRAVDLLLLAETMIWEREYEAAAEVCRRAAAQRDEGEGVRVRAAHLLGRLYLDHLGQAPKGIRLLRRILEKQPNAPQANDIRRELAELEQMGYPVWEWVKKPKAKPSEAKPED